MIVMTGKKWQHARVSKVLLCRNRRRVPVVERYQEALIQVSRRGLLVEYVLSQSFRHLVDVEVTHLLTPDVKDGLHDPELELTAVTHSHKRDEIVLVKIGWVGALDLNLYLCHFRPQCL
jgi:hypothetical protein